MSEIKKALEEVEACENIIRPYGYHPTGAAILKVLNQIRELLKTPSKTSADRCISIIEKAEDALIAYRYVSLIEDLLKHLSKLEEHLTRSKEKSS